MKGGALVIAILTLSLGMAQAGMAQERVQEVPPAVTFEIAPDGVRYVVIAADSIVSSGAAEDISLEAFNSDIATGVYLYGTFNGKLESLGYGRDPNERRYLWLSVDRGDSLDYMAMLYDVNKDLAPDFLLFRTVDWRRRVENLTEYAAPSVRGIGFDISVQPACVVPRCDPTTWTVQDRTRIDVPDSWFDMWRPILAFAAMRGERWLGRPVAALPQVRPQP